MMIIHLKCVCGRRHKLNVISTCFAKWDEREKIIKSYLFFLKFDLLELCKGVTIKSFAFDLKDDKYLDRLAKTFFTITQSMLMQ